MERILEALGWPRWRAGQSLPPAGTMRQDLASGGAHAGKSPIPRRFTIVVFSGLASTASCRSYVMSLCVFVTVTVGRADDDDEGCILFSDSRSCQPDARGCLFVLRMGNSQCGPPWLRCATAQFPSVMTDHESATRCAGLSGREE